MFEFDVRRSMPQPNTAAATAALHAMQYRNYLVSVVLVAFSPRGNDRVLGFAVAPGVVQLRHQPAVVARQAPCCVGQCHGRDYRR